MGSAVELRAQVDDIDVPAEGAEASEPGLDRDARGGILSLLSVILAYQTVLFLPWKTISPHLMSKSAF